MKMKTDGAMKGEETTYNNMMTDYDDDLRQASVPGRVGAR
jgi:hypothetical protein